MSDNPDYSTDEFGRPNDRNYTYRVPIDSTVAFWKASRHLRGLTDRFVTELSDHDGNDLSHIVIKSKDNKGPLEGLGEYQYSEKWERPFRGSRADWEVRRANKGGTKIRGTFTAFDRFGGEVSVPFNTTVDMTLGEVKKAANKDDQDLLDELNEKMTWVKRDAIEDHREEVYAAQQDCDHEHFVEDDDAIYDDPTAIGFCEDCGAELDDDMSVVGGRAM